MTTQTVIDKVTEGIGTDRYPVGTLAAIGCKPAAAWKYEGPAQPNMTQWTLTATSTHDSLEKVLIPYPMRVNRNAPPTLTISALVNPRRRKMDGGVMPYCAVLFAAPCVYTDSAGTDHFGVTGREYVSSINAEDQTQVADFLVAYGQIFGVYKPLANIRFMPDCEDLYITADRQGTRLMNMRIKKGDLISNDINPFAAASADYMTMREIPNVNYTGYVDRSICAYPRSRVSPKKVWQAEASIELGSDRLHALGMIDILEMGPAFVSIGEITKEEYMDHRVIEQLPIEAGGRSQSRTTTIDTGKIGGEALARSA